jgi:sulfotransferase family protein
MLCWPARAAGNLGLTLPNFLVIGAGRSGTTSIHKYLAQHPDVFVCAEKSPNFFVAHEPLPSWEGASLQAMARQWITDAHDYEALFRAAGSRRAIGEVSPVYLQARSAPARIHAMCRDVRLIAILREPVARAYAHFLGRRRDGLERRTDFADVVRDELSRPLPDDVAFGSYLGCGRYHHFLSGYFERFPRERIRIYLYEDLQANPAALMADLFAFLGVDSAFAPDMTRHHGQTGVAANPAARFLWTRSVRVRTALRPWLPRRIRDRAAPIFLGRLERPALDPVLRRRLSEVFGDDIDRLEQLINRDLSHWRSGPAPESAPGGAAGGRSAANGSNAENRGPDPHRTPRPTRTDA